MRFHVVPRPGQAGLSRRWRRLCLLTRNISTTRNTSTTRNAANSDNVTLYRIEILPKSHIDPDDPAHRLDVACHIVPDRGVFDKSRSRPASSAHRLMIEATYPL